MPDTNEVKSMLKEFYNRNAADRNVSEVQDWKIKIRDNFLKCINAEKKTTLLEIGAGTGKDSKFFMDNGLIVTAVDLSSEMVKHCKDKGIKTFEMDFYNLSNLNTKFDCIWSMNSLLHVKSVDLSLVLSEINKVLKPSGLFFMGVYGGEDWEGITVKEEYNLPRYFSLLADETIKTMVSGRFDIVSFDKIFSGSIENKWNFQSLVMRKKVS